MRATTAAPPIGRIPPTSEASPAEGRAEKQRPDDNREDDGSGADLRPQCAGVRLRTRIHGEPR